MDFTFAPEYVALRKLVREFAEEEVRPLAKRVDRESMVPHETLRKAGIQDLVIAGMMRKRLGFQRTIWGYDTFEGMTAPQYSENR